jgi:hypothetical protein
MPTAVSESEAVMRDNEQSDGPATGCVDSMDLVIAAYKKDVDRTLLRENLKLTVEERFRRHANVWAFAQELREAGRRMRGEKP